MQVSLVEDIGVLTTEMIAALRCPVCAAPFVRPMVCESGHSFDVARQGYVHLGAGRRLPEGDTAAMVEAREAVLPLFAPLTEKLAQFVPTSARLLVDLGGGTGYHLSHVLRGGAQGIVFDVSKPALRRAAKVAERVGAVLADTWGRVPLADASVDVILNVFAPRNGPEMRRIVRDRLIVATPLPHHLIELRSAFGLLDVDPSKEERLAQTLDDFELTTEDRLEWTLDLDAAQAAQIVAMGPNAFHGRVEGRAMRTIAAVRVTTWRPA